MTTEHNIVLTIEEIVPNTLIMKNTNYNEKQLQKSQNTIIFTKEEQKLDRQIRATINRNIIRQQRQIAYLQAIRHKRQQRRRRFGLKFK